MQSKRLAVFCRADVTPGTPGQSEAPELGGLTARAGRVVLSDGREGATGTGRLPPRTPVLVVPGLEGLAGTLRSPGTVRENLLQYPVRVTGPREAVSALREAPLEETAHGQG